jgi:hypothetical protein
MNKIKGIIIIIKGNVQINSSAFNHRCFILYCFFFHNKFIKTFRVNYEYDSSNLVKKITVFCTHHSSVCRVKTRTTQKVTLDLNS